MYEPIVQIDEKHTPLFILTFEATKAGSTFMGVITYCKEGNQIKGIARIRNEKTFDKRVFTIGKDIEYTKDNYDRLKTGLQMTAHKAMPIFGGDNYTELEFCKNDTLEQILDKMETSNLFNIKKNVKKEDIEKTVDKMRKEM